MRKYFQVLTVLSVLLFLVWLRNAKFEDDVTIGITTNSPTPFPSPTETLVLTPTNLPPTSKSGVKSLPTATLTPTITKTGLYKDGSFSGSVEDAYYGMVQVQAIIAGGSITDVVFLQFPNDNRTSQNINSQAMPLLKEEAIQAQSANVSGVSGASFTSPAFIASLTTALSQAKN